MRTRVGIALGTNIGDRVALLSEARDLVIALAPSGSSPLQSSIYQTKPVDCPPGSPDFYNAVLEMSYDCSAEELLKNTQAIEKQLGRNRSGIRNAPRPIDLDILYFGDERIDQKDLIVPHPRLHQRRFVLQPLAEIRATLVLPGAEKTIAETLENLSSLEAELTLVQKIW